MRKIFQYVLMGLGGFLFVVAIILFATYSPSKQAEQTGYKANLTMWGWLPSATMTQFVSSIQEDYPDLKISYREYPEDQFDQRVTDALAAGKGPDLLLVDNNHVLQYKNRIEILDFTQYPESAYRAEFVDASGSLLLPWAVMAVPIAMDPVVLYSNTDLLSAGFISAPARTWEELFDHIRLFTTSDVNGKIDVATIPLGNFSNVKNATDIIMMLIYQQGNPMVQFIGNKFVSTVRGVPNAPANIDSSISRPLEFFLAFSRPSSEVYTWNAEFPQSDEAFISEQSIYYLGLASEYNSLRKRNPNLNIGVSIAPQISTDVTAKKRTSARVYGVAMIKLSSNKLASFNAMQALASQTAASSLTTIGFAPARKDLIGIKQSDPRIDVIYKSSMIAQSWWNPDNEDFVALLQRSFRSLEAQTESTFDVIGRIDTFLDQRFSGLVPPTANSNGLLVQ